MRQLILDNLEHFLCGVLLVSRLGDIISTRLVSPKLELEANPIVRKLGWKFAVLTVLVCLVPYLSTPMAVALLVPFLLVSASNTSRIWVVRTMGETAYAEMIRGVARKAKLTHAIAGAIVSSLFIMLTGSVLLFFYPDPDEDWGYWFAIGIVLYGFIIGFYGCLYLVRLFRRARRDPVLPRSGSDL